MRDRLCSRITTTPQRSCSPRSAASGRRSETALVREGPRRGHEETRRTDPPPEAARGAHARRRCRRDRGLTPAPEQRRRRNRSRAAGAGSGRCAGRSRGRDSGRRSGDQTRGPVAAVRRRRRSLPPAGGVVRVSRIRRRGSWQIHLDAQTTAFTYPSNRFIVYHEIGHAVWELVLGPAGRNSFTDARPPGPERQAVRQRPGPALRPDHRDVRRRVRPGSPAASRSR